MSWGVWRPNTPRFVWTVWAWQWAVLLLLCNSHIYLFCLDIQREKSRASSPTYYILILVHGRLCDLATNRNRYCQAGFKGISPVVLTFGNSNFAGGMLSVLFAYHFIYAVIKKKLLPKQISLVIALAVSSTFPAVVQGYLIILFAIVVGISFLIARKFKSPRVNPALSVG